MRSRSIERERSTAARPTFSSDGGQKGRTFRRMLVRRSGHLLILGLVLATGCTTVIREEISDDSSASPTTANPGTGATSTDGSTTDADDAAESSSSSGTAGEIGSEAGSDSGGWSAAECRNGIIEGLEDCDCGENDICSEKELGGIGCVALGSHPDVPGTLTGGVLLCSSKSCRYDVANCFYCGDGWINGNEGCEPDIDLESSCQELGMGLGEVFCNDDCQIDTSQCNTCGWVYDFDEADCPGDWTTGRTTDAAAQSSWACGSTDNHAGGPGFLPSRVWATNLSGSYQGNESSYFASPSLDLGNCSGQDITMTVRHWFSLEVNDGGVVQVATADPDEESSWTTIEPVAGSFYSAVVAANHPPVAGNPAFSTFDASEGTWVNAEFDLSDYAGADEFYVRFVFGSDDTLASGGWYVDTIEILGNG